ncbi:MAG: efflux RND transporter periplasmic adaptor subunit [Ignavibacteriales bacterium]|nr:efflux RND transporter periplasmic adaptor subunit [Ignavibacteriales bacterium]
MKTKLKIVISFLLTIFLLVLLSCGSETEKQEEVVVPVKVYNVQPESLIQYLKLTGTITAGKDQILYSKMYERIEKLYVKAGDRVSTNQTIARQYNASLSQGVEVAKANLNNAETQYELAKQNFQRMERLFEQRAISTQQFDQASAQFKAAGTGLEVARAQYHQSLENYQNSIIKSPFSGVVAAVFIEQNQTVSTGQKIAQIIDPSTMKSKIKVASRDISLIKIGKEVEVSIPSIPNKKYNGNIKTIDQAVDPVSKTLEIEVVITDADDNIKSGMYAEYMIPINSVERAKVVPETALLSQTEVQINRETGTQETLKRYFLFVVENGKAKMKEVQVGLISNNRVEITEGLNFNDKVIVVGNNIVQDNQKVNIID